MVSHPYVVEEDSEEDALKFVKYVESKIDTFVEKRLYEHVKENYGEEHAEKLRLMSGIIGLSYDEKTSLIYQLGYVMLLEEKSVEEVENTFFNAESPEDLIDGWESRYGQIWNRKLEKN
ncbi:MAG: hypothetical protein J7K98_01810 [Candidatus Aenigmarchaeota archaeon]|nr:hypothetical protein [Candidatus Aenigmarchaeota archaeon]